MDTILQGIPSEPIARAERCEVTALDTAEALGSGELGVLATPRLVAWLEGAAWRAIADYLPQGHTSVGTMIHLEHLAPSPVGSRVEVMATVTELNGRMVAFELQAHAGSTLLARGEHRRAVVERARFERKVAGGAE